MAKTWGACIALEQLGLLQHRLRRLPLFVRGTAVLPQDALHDHAQMRTDVLPDGPVAKIELIPFSLSRPIEQIEQPAD
jgi:hypothetical protein